jgi:hypothetical protein
MRDVPSLFGINNGYFMDSYAGLEGRQIRNMKKEEK